MARRSFRWLHLTDLHAGMDEPRWRTVEQAFLDDVEAWVAKEPLDAVLFTGDLTEYARPDDFRALDQFREKLWKRFQAHGRDPVLLAVPGNHDLVRPKYPPALGDADRDDFWKDPQHPARRVVTEAFGPWIDWWKRVRPISVQDGLLPGEFRWSGGGEDLRVAVVGLNTAALHLQKHVEGRLVASHRQLHEPWGDFHDWQRLHDVCLLLSHHGRTWLDPTSREEWDRDIHDPRRVAVHLFGHQHLATREAVSRDGGEVRHRVLGHALFGKEGRSRAFGYGLHSVDLDPGARLRWTPSVRVWEKVGDRHEFVPHPNITPKTEDLGRARRDTVGLALPETAAVGQRVVEFLDRHYSLRSSRRGILREVGLPEQEWATVPVSDMGRVLSAVRDETDDPDVARQVDRLLASLRVLDDDSDEVTQEAARHLNAGAFGKAAELLSGLVELGTSPRVRARARVNLTAALLGLGDRVKAKEILAQAERAHLPQATRVRAARWWVALGNPDLAESFLDPNDRGEADAVRQLVALHRGQEVPDPADDPDVLRWVGARRLERHDAPGAWELAERAWSLAPDLHTLRLGAQVLLDHWLGAQCPLGDPATALAAVREWSGKVEDEEVRTWLDAIEAVLDESPGDPRDDDDPGPDFDWRPALEAASVADADTLRGIVARESHRGPVLMAAADRWLALGDPEQAVALARRAFALLPGHGQRALLCQSLVTAGRADEAAGHLSALVPPRCARARRVVAHHLLGKHAFPDVLELVDGWDSAEAWVWRAAAEHGLGLVDEARQSARQALRRTDRLTPHGLERLVRVVSGGDGPDTGLARLLMAALDRDDLAGDPNAEMLRLQLMLGGVTPTRPVDGPALERSGFVSFVPDERVLGFVRDLRQKRELLGHLWTLGGIAFEAYAERSLWPAGLAGVRVREGEFGAVPPMAADATWEGRWCLAGALAIEVLVAFGLHDEVGHRVAGLVVFEDAFARFQAPAGEAQGMAWEREREDWREHWAPFDRLPVRAPGAAETVLTGELVPGALAWLGAVGEIKVRHDPPWEPPPTFVIDGTAVVELARSGHAVRFLDACRDRSRAASLDEQSVRLRDARVLELSRLLSAKQLAATARAWLGEMQAGGRLRIEPVPPPPTLPPPRAAAADDPAVLRTFAARELLAREPELVLMTAEFSEVGLLGVVPAVAEGRPWTRESYSAHRDRYRAATKDRVVSLARVCRTASPADRRSDVLGALAKAGWADALDSDDVLALQRDFGTLAAAEPRRRLGGVVAAAGFEGIRHGVMFLEPITAALATAVARRWFDEPPRDRDEDVVDLLNAAARFDDESRGRHRVLERTITFLGAACAGRLEAFAEIDGDRATGDAELPGPQLWKFVVGWARRTGRWGAVSLGLARLFQWRQRLPTIVRESVVPLILTAFPGGKGPLDLCDRALAAVWNDPTGRRSLEDVQVRGDSMAKWRRLAIEELLTSEWKSGRWEGSRVHVPVGQVDVVLPLEATWPEVHPIGKDLASFLWPLEGRVAEALRDWPAPDASESLRHALDGSALADAEADPTVVLGWSRSHDLGGSGPRDVAELRRLLGEPPVTSAPPARRWRDILADTGAWATRPTDALVEVLQHVPEMAGAGAAHARSVVDDVLGAQDRELERFLDGLRHPGRLSSGMLASMIGGLATSARTDPVRRDGDHVESLPDLAARIAVIGIEEQSDAMAAHECALVRMAASVVDRLVDPGEPDRAWLSWRLYGWWRRILEHRTGELERLAESAPPARSPEACEGPLDPWRAAPDRLNVRHHLLLYTLSALDPRASRFSWAALVPALTRLADRPVSAEDQRYRQGDVLCATDLARWLLLRHDPALVFELSPERRMAWLDESLRERNGAFREVSDAVLVALAARPHRWSEAERRRVYEGLVDRSDFPPLPWGHLAVVAGRFEDAPPVLVERGTAATFEHLSDPTTGSALASVWLIARHLRGDLSAATDLLLGEVARQGLDPVPFLHALTGPVLASTGTFAATARPIVREKLATHPATATDERLREILRQLEGP